MYVLSILVRNYFKPYDVVRNFNFKPKVSVLMSAFNEGRHVYDTLESLANVSYPKDKIDIIAFDDHSKDDTFKWMQAAAAEHSNIFVKRNEVNKGKALTMLEAAKMATGDYIIGVDSDCIFKEDCIDQLMACFTEPKIKAVGGRVGIKNINETWICGVQAVFYISSYFMMKSIENLFRKVQCLSGPLVAIEKSVYLSLEKEILNRSFLGAKITNGEDRALTQMILRLGYDTYVNTDSVCWTSAPTTLSQYLKQQLRWRRSAIGQWIDALVYLPRILKNSTLSSAFFSIMPIYVILVWNLMLLNSITNGVFLYVIAFIIIFHGILGPFFALGFLIFTRNDKVEKIQDPVKFIISMILASFWFPISGVIITLIALFTLDDGGWVTRSVNK